VDDIVTILSNEIALKNQFMLFDLIGDDFF